MNLRIRNLIRGRADRNNEKGLIDAVEALREKLSAKDYQALQELMVQIPEAQRTALGVLPTRMLTGIHRRIPFKRINLWKELVWVTLVLSAASKFIGKFINLNSQLSTATMNGEFSKAYSITEQIDSACGLSLFTIEARIALLQMNAGLEAQRNYANELEHKGKRSFPAFIAHHVSRRNEESISLTRFVQRLSKQISAWELEEDLTNYVAFRLLGRIPDAMDGLADLLRHEHVSSIVDLYETFILVLRVALSRDTIDEDTLVPLLKELIRLEICDPRLSILILLLSKRLNIPVKSSALPDYVIQFNRGRYAEAHATALMALAQDPADTGALLYATRAMAALRLTPPSGRAPSERMIGMLLSVLARDSAAERSMANLSKLCLNLRFVPAAVGVSATATLAFKLRGLADSETETAVVVARGWPDLLDVDLFSNVSGLQGGPFRDLAAERLVEQQLVQHTKANRLKEALQAATALISSPSQCDRLDASIANSWLRYLLQDSDGAIDFIAKEVSKHEHLYLAFPINELMRRLSPFKHIRKKLSRLSVVIFVYLEYKLAPSQDNRNHVRWACDEFLTCHKLDRPSSVAQEIAKFDPLQVLYFLREICTTDTLQSVRGLKTSRAAQEERLNICSLLTTMDPERAESYREEIKFLTAHLLIEEGVQIVDRSRLFVNVDGISKWAEQELRESFDIYMSRRSSSDEKSKLEFASAIRELVTERKPLSTQYLELPRDDHNSMLVSIVKDLHEQYLRNPKHGLDYYLSMRIRHGTLSGTLRGPLEERKLLTTFDSKAGRYRENEHWASKCTIFHPEAYQEIGRILGEFSARYDALVESEVKSNLYIKKDGNSSLIGMPLSPVGFNLIRHSISDKMTFEDFLAICYKVFRQALSEELATVRTQLETRFAQGLHELVQDVLSKLHLVIPEHHWSDLKSSLTVATSEAINSLMKVIDWLDIEEVGDLKSNFTIQQIVEVALESAKTTLRGFTPKVSTSLSVERRMDVSVLSTIADIVFITIENVYKHSRVTDPPWIKINISNETEDALTIEISSEVAVGGRTPEAEDILTEIRDMIRSDAYHSRVAKEGRSGLIKIKRIVGHIPGDHLTFGFKSDVEFLVNVKLGISPVADKDGRELFSEVAR